jgi:hypothetical protein
LRGIRGKPEKPRREKSENPDDLLIKDIVANDDRAVVYRKAIAPGRGE